MTASLRSTVWRSFEKQLVYQVDTRLLIGERSRRLGRRATLDDVPDDFLDEVTTLGFGWVWLLGVWQTGAAGRSVSRGRQDWREEFREVLPDLREEDISGSPFAVQAYTVDVDLGGDSALVRLRARLARRGVRLMLDFVPNHTACDHSWARIHPEYYLHGTEAELAREPESFLRVEVGDAVHVLAHGRDPNFPAWPDTLQLDYRHEGARGAMVDELRRIAARCDGVRCDMAMLLLPEVIRRTWGERPGPADGSRPVDTPFWPFAIEAVRRDRPDFLFVAEVYWGLEVQLQQQGFDFTYDKPLYDRLRSGPAGAVRERLHAPVSLQDRSVRFLENHDEARAAASFAPEPHRAAAVVAYLLPGLRLFHDGQLEGRKVKASIHLARRLDEPVDVPLRDFYRQLLAVLRRPEAHGRWRSIPCLPAWPGNDSCEGFIASTWEGEGGALLVTVNFAPTRGQCFVPVPLPGLGRRVVKFVDLLSEARYEREGGDLETRGLYQDLPGWGRHVFEVS